MTKLPTSRSISPKRTTTNTTILLVNPYDPDGVAAAIGQARSMPLAQRRERHDALFRVLSHNDIQHWADRFLAALERDRRL